MRRDVVEAILYLYDKKEPRKSSEIINILMSTNLNRDNGEYILNYIFYNDTSNICIHTIAVDKEKTIAYLKDYSSQLQ